MSDNLTQKQSYPYQEDTLTTCRHHPSQCDMYKEGEVINSNRVGFVKNYPCMITYFLLFMYGPFKLDSVNKTFDVQKCTTLGCIVSN